MNVIVTGHEGYIGRVLIPKLVANGHHVKGIDLGLYLADDFPFTPPEYANVVKDIRHITLDDLRGCDAIIHLAALSNDPRDEWPKNVIDNINHQASVNLARLSKSAGVKRFIFSSSCSVYGTASDARARTELDKTIPITEYAKSKQSSEKDIQPLGDSGFCPVFMRNATVYGYSSSLRFDMLVNNFAANALFYSKISISGDGLALRPQIHIQDLTDIFLQILEAPDDRVFNQIINVGFDDENYQIKEIAEKVKTVLKDTEIHIAKKSDPDARSYRVDFSKLQRLFHPQQNWTCERGVQELVDHIRNIPSIKELFERKAGQRLAQLKDVDQRFPNFFMLKY